VSHAWLQNILYMATLVGTRYTVPALDTAIW